MRDLSCRTNDRDQPHGGKIRHKCALYCCDLLVVFFFVGLVFIRTGSIVRLSGLIFGGFLFPQKAEIYEQINNYRILKKVPAPWD